MSSYKNQHYVPRCLLKPFTLSGEGKAINLYNIAADRFIAQAPVKNQCSRNFFYGVDLGPEKALAELEGQYARISELICGRKEISSSDVDWLRLFSIIQTRRTARAISQLKQFMIGMADEAFENHPDQRPADPEHDELVVISMKQALHFAARIDDLKCILLVNETAIQFSISDHPSILSNRFDFEARRPSGFGLASSGTFLFLPIAPDVAALFFDIGVYSVSIPRGTKFVNVVEASDIRALNELQELNAEQNVYFSDWSKREQFVLRDEKLANQRALRPDIRTFIQAGDLPEGTFRLATAEERGSNRPRLLQAGTRHPCPRNWPRFLKMRKNPITFGDGSAAGLVRKAEWLRPGALDGPPEAVSVA